MKIEEINFKDNCILLGIFRTNTFQHIELLNPQIKQWVDFNGIIPLEKRGGTILSRVNYMCNWADQIIFVLDDVKFPINTDASVTCGELELVCKNMAYFEKTVFVKQYNVINFDINLAINYPIYEKQN